MLEMIVSGGQTGADQAAWRAAKQAGIRCSGWMPRWFMTEVGRRPQFANLYGAREMPTTDYPARNVANANEADACIYFTWTAWSPGLQSTLDAIEAVEREEPYPFKRVRMAGPSESEAARWVVENAIRRLWVAGNRESKAPGIGEWVEAYMIEVFRLVAVLTAST